jgi:hypothetical protein
VAGQIRVDFSWAFVYLPAVVEGGHVGVRDGEIRVGICLLLNGMDSVGFAGPASQSEHDKTFGWQLIAYGETISGRGMCSSAAVHYRCAKSASMLRTFFPWARFNISTSNFLSG